MANTEPVSAATLRAIIVDDEERARRSLETLLTLHCPNMQVVAQSHNVPKAVLDIKQYRPDVVFLDIEMPEFNGFELFNFFEEVNFEVVFVTAYSDYAIKAFEFSAVDYLLKPAQVDKLKAAVEKVLQRLHSNNMKQRIDALRHNYQSDEFTKIALPVTDGLLFVEVNQIAMLQAEGGYTHVFLADGSKLLVSKKLLFFEELLDKRKSFYRIHRSHLINLNYVKKYSRIESYIEMDNGISMPVSKERKKDFEQSLSEIRVRKL
jgi:two-component system LytT family response regulator